MAKAPLLEEDSYFSFKDLKWMLKKRGKVILGIGLLCMIVSSFLGLVKPIHYEAEAYFREKSNTQRGSGVLASFLGKSDSDDSITAIMPSRRVAEQVVQKLCVEGEIKEVKSINIMDTVVKKLFLEKLSIQNRYFFSENNEAMKKLFSQNRDSALTCRLHHYKGGDEFFRSFIIEPLSDRVTYKLWDAKKKYILGTYSLGQDVILNDCSFIVEGPKFIAGELSLKFWPRSVIAEKLKLNIVIKKSKENQKFIYISYKDKDPYLAALIVNQFIASYKEFMDNENISLIKEQISYLQKRQEGLLQEYEEVMQEGAAHMKSYIEKNGVRGISSKDETFTKLECSLNEQLLKVQRNLMILDTKEGIEHIQNNNLSQGLINEKLKLIQERELLQIALQEENAGQEEVFDKRWSAYSEELGHLQNELKLITELQTQLVDPKALELFWEQIKDLLIIQKLGISPFFDEKRADDWLGSLGKYLDNTIHFLKLRENLITERLSYKRTPHKIYQGLDLSSARSIQFNLIGSIQSQTSQSNRLAMASKRLEDTKCDLSTLSSFFSQDEYVKKHLAEASEINFKLQDSYNNSPKEHERLKNSLYLKRVFLEMHVRETNAVNQLQKKLTEQELVLLKINMLELYDQTIMVLEEQIWNLQEKLKSQLQKEEALIKTSMAQLNKDAGCLPLQWLQQEKILISKEINIKIMTELVKTIEAKNIAKNSERMECSAIDEARPPLMPERPYLIQWAFLGLSLGIFGATFTYLLLDLKKGAIATESNIVLQGGRVLGELRNGPEDINTMRRAISFINQNAHLKTIYILGDNFKKSFELMSYLLALQDKRVLFLDASFFDPEESSGGKDFELYLMGHSAVRPLPQSLEEGYDKLATGGYSPFAAEFLNTHKFEELMRSFVDVYDKIIIFIPLTPEAIGLSVTTSNGELILVVSKERLLSELKPYISMKKPVGFFL